MNPIKPKNRNFLLLYWVCIAGILLYVDYFSGPFIQFPVTYLIPVALAAWFNGRLAGIFFAVLLPLGRLSFNVFFWDVPWTTTDASINFIIRVIVFVLFAVVIDRTAKLSRLLEKKVELLEGLLPICSFCKKIKNSEEKWQPIEQYIGEHSHASFSHGLCPDCRKEHYSDLFKK